MKMLVYTYPYSLLFWGAFVWAFIPEFRLLGRGRRQAASIDSPDAGSFKVIIAGMWVAFASAFPLSSVRAWRFGDAAQLPAFWIGLALLVAGSLMRRHCWRMLGASFTADVRASGEQRVITSGAYAYLRHPSYTAGTIMNVGIGIALGSWASTLLLAVATLAVYLYRMRVEERALVAAIGAPYVEFMRTRKRIIPFVY